MGKTSIRGGDKCRIAPPSSFASVARDIETAPPMGSAPSTSNRLPSGDVWMPPNLTSWVAEIIRAPLRLKPMEASNATRIVRGEEAGLGPTDARDIISGTKVPYAPPRLMRRHWQPNRTPQNDAISRRPTRRARVCVTGTGSSMTTWQSENHNVGNGSSVKLIQIKVNDWFKEYRRRGVSGVPANLTTDGVYGSKSKAATVWLQNRWDIDADGKVGSVTWAKLKLG